MSRIYLFFIVCLGIYIFIHTRLFKTMRKNLQGQNFVTKKNLTMFDVRTLILNGKKDQAIAAYRNIFKVSQAEAAAHVESLERSIQEKNES